LKLGVLYKNSKIVNHRSLLKVILNPIFRYFGLCIGSKFNNNNQFIKYQIFRCKRVRYIKYTLETNDYDKIVKYRTII